MKYTHKIDFFSNTLKIVVEHGLVTKVEQGGVFATCCPECLEDIEDYWLITEKKGGLIALCPSANCEGGNWPVTKIATGVTK
jgi:hypothetical protein